MTDERYVFAQISRERKNLGHSARHKVCGSKTKFVSLPSDNLTARQLRERNGEMKTYKLGERMDWRTFRDMPSTLQLSYLTFMKEGMGMNLTEMGEAFGVTRMAVRNYIEKMEWPLTFSRGGHRKTETQAHRFAAFMDGENVASSYPIGGFENEDISDAAETAQIDTSEAAPVICESVPAPLPVQPDAFLPPRAGHLEYEGTPARVMDAIYQLLPDGEYEFSLTFRRKL